MGPHDLMCKSERTSMDPHVLGFDQRPLNHRALLFAPISR